MTKTFIGGILLGTIFVFGAIVPLVLIRLLGLGLALAVPRVRRRLSSERHGASASRPDRRSA
jgi:F0F1-type ATP synthase assembly protein I